MKSTKWSMSAYGANTPYPTLFDTQKFNDTENFGRSARLERACGRLRRILQNPGQVHISKATVFTRDAAILRISVARFVESNNATDPPKVHSVTTALLDAITDFLAFVTNSVVETCCARSIPTT
jgi:hypothetical protein